jgi:hypothetical protein
MAIIYIEGHPCHVLESLYVPNTLNYFVQLNANYVCPVTQAQIFRRCLTSENPKCTELDKFYRVTNTDTFSFKDHTWYPCSFPQKYDLLVSDRLTRVYIIIIIIFINCNWVTTRWQWLFYMYTNMERKKK